MKFLSDHKKIVIFSIVLLLIIIGIWQYKKSSTPKPTEIKPIVISNENIVSFSGRIDAFEKATLRFQAGGQIAWIGVKEGDIVKKYQTLASLDQQTIQKQIQKYLNTYSKTRNDFDQATKDTYNNIVITDTIKRALSDAQLDLNSAVLDVQIQDITKQLAFLWTPIPGIVTKSPALVSGTNISLPTQAEFEVVNPESLYFSASADQTEVIKIKPGQIGELVLDAFPQETLIASISAISFVPIENESSTIYEVKIQLPPTSQSTTYRLGMTGDVSFKL